MGRILVLGRIAHMSVTLLHSIFSYFPLGVWCDKSAGVQSYTEKQPVGGVCVYLFPQPHPSHYV